MPNQQSIIVHIDRVLTVNNLSSFMQKINNIFIWKEQMLPNFHLDLLNTEDADLLGIVVLYKMLEYSVVHKCFIQPSIYLSNKLKTFIKKYGFSDLVTELMKQKDIKSEFENLKPEIKDDFFVAPIALWSGHKISQKDWNYRLYPLINNYYKNENISLMIFQFFTELYSNFLSHSHDQSKSIMVAHGTNKWIEIACVDTGIGIVESLRKKYPKKRKKDVLWSAMQKKVSSNLNDGHMGYGLWTIDETIKLLGAKLQIWSNGAYYRRLGKKIWLSDSVNWTGVIIYVRFPVEYPILFKDIEKNNNDNLVNFI